MTPRISIITINKGDTGIVATLSALTSLPEVTSAEAEVVVVDASEGRLDDISRHFAGVVWVPFDPIPGRVTIPHQRNVGVRASQGDIIVFIDASCVPGEAWLPRLCAPLLRGEETCTAGSHWSPSRASLRDQASLRLTGSLYVDEAPTINVAFRRDVFDSVSGFDESFDYGSDVDFFWRARAAGHRIRYVPEATVTHEWGGWRAEARRSFAYGRARARLYIKHPTRWRDLLGRDSPVLLYPAYLLLLPVTLRRPYLHLALLVPLYRNRARRPFAALADHMLYGAGVIRQLVSSLVRL